MSDDQDLPAPQLRQPREECIDLEDEVVVRGFEVVALGAPPEQKQRTASICRGGRHLMWGRARTPITAIIATYTLAGVKDSVVISEPD